MVLYIDLLYNTTPIHCTPLPLQPPVMNTQNSSEIRFPLEVPIRGFPLQMTSYKTRMVHTNNTCFISHLITCSFDKDFLFWQSYRTNIANTLSYMLAETMLADLRQSWDQGGSVSCLIEEGAPLSLILRIYIYIYLFIYLCI